MTREPLADAASHLRTAAERATSDTERDRLADIAEQVDRRAESDRGPDHGRMARWQSALDELRDDVDEDGVKAIDDAKAKISEYRETVEGV